MDPRKHLVDRLKAISAGGVRMWNNIVSNPQTRVQAAFRPLAETAHDHAIATLGIVLIFALVIAMLAAEIADGRADAVRIDQVPSDRPRR